MTSPYSSDFVVSCVSRDFLYSVTPALPYSRDFVVSLVPRHFWKRLESYTAGMLEGWKVGRLSECLFMGYKSDNF